MSATSIDVGTIRAQFPALSSRTVFLENAGGSQVPHQVPDRVAAYFRENYVQLDAGYPESDRSTQTVKDAHAFIDALVNAGDVGVSILGSSSSILLHVLAGAYAPLVRGREIVIAESGHEANVGPWVRLEAAGAKIVWWKVDPATGAESLDDLGDLLNSNTALVIFPQVSNLLGAVADVPRITEMAHAVGAKVVVDGVAYAPHRAVDFAGWGVDWYAMSLYKVYGPHLGALVGRHDALAELAGPNHFFISENEIPYKWEVGGVPHELCAALLGTRDYLSWLGGGAGRPFTAEVGARAFGVMAERELPLQRRLVEWLLERGMRVVGPETGDESRVGTVSFLHPELASTEVVAAAHAADVGIRNGHMYAYRLCRAMGIDQQQGVTRVSLVHYNSDEDLDRLFAAWDSVL